MKIKNLLDALEQEFERKGHYVSRCLNEGLSKDQIREKTQWFNHELADEVVELYRWKNGQSQDAWEVEYPFYFRDNTFCDLSRAEKTYRQVLELDAPALINSGLGRPDLTTCFPFAEFNGEYFLIPCVEIKWDGISGFPILDRFGDVYFHSFESMLKTCIDWVHNSSYDEWGSLNISEEKEREIWEKHNPGIFSHRAG